MKYPTYLRNHAVYPDSKKALHAFVNSSIAGKLIEGTYESLEKVSENMGWLTWACLTKIVLRAIVPC